MNNVTNLCENIIPSNALAIHNILNNKGYDTYFVGGALRDYFINDLLEYNFKIKDWDIVTTARHEDMRLLFNKRLRVNERGKIVSKVAKTDLLIPRLETTGISINGYLFEVTPMSILRNDEVVFIKNIKEDLSRRDFTINTIVYSPKLGLITEFLSDKGFYINALEDIKNRIIRATDEADKCFKQNRYHIIRAIIFANKYDFKIEDKTLTALKENVKEVCEINKGKLAIGFEKLITSTFTEGIYYLKTTGVLKVLCENWTDSFSDELINILFELNKLNDIETYVDRLIYVYKKFSNKELLLSLFKSFGVNKDLIYKIEKNSGYKDFKQC